MTATPPSVTPEEPTTAESRRRHHEQAIAAAQRAVPHPAYVGPVGATPEGGEGRRQRQTVGRAHLLRTAGIHDEDLDENTREFVDWLTGYGDADTLGGVCALIEAALGHITGGEPARTPALRVGEVHQPRCCDRPDPEATWGLGRPDNAFVSVDCTSCGTELVTLDPPSCGNAAPYVGDLRRGVEPAGPWTDD